MRVRLVALTLIAAAFSAFALSACGGDSSGQAKTLLQQTFGGHHRVDSGNLSFNLTVNPTGSSTLTTPLTLSLAGPFQSLGAGKLPRSNFTISISGLGKSGSLGLVSTGQTGFFTLEGTGYQMPAATFQKLESAFSGLAQSGSGGSGTGSGALAKLGIDPLRWLVNPSIAGSETVGGAETTHIKSGVNVAALLGDLNTFLQKASSLGVSNTGIPTSISAATRTKIANEIHNPRFDVWTGRSDKTPRKLTIALTLPVTGQISTLLGGLRSADIALTMQYGELNQPQTIAAPTNLRPLSEFTAKLKGIEQALNDALNGTLGGTAGASATATSATANPSATASGPATTSTPANVRSYSQCIQAAGNDVGKMQSCASLLQAK